MLHLVVVNTNNRKDLRTHGEGVYNFFITAAAGIRRSVSSSNFFLVGNGEATMARVLVGFRPHTCVNGGVRRAVVHCRTALQVLHQYGRQFVGKASGHTHVTATAVVRARQHHTFVAGTTAGFDTHNIVQPGTWEWLW